jgi:glycosyltransferase involved in cell wall biosynthesis
MRIALVGPLPPLRGGISHYNNSLFEELISQGHDVLPLAFEKLYPNFLFPGTSESDPQAKSIQRAKYDLVSWNPLTWIKAKHRLLHFKPDVMIIHHWHPFFVPVLSFLCSKCTKSKKVAIVHNVLPHENETIGRILNPILYKRVHRLFVGATAEKKKLLDLVPGSNVEVTPHPIYDRFTKDNKTTDQKAAKLSLGYSQAQTIFMHLGLVRQYKGLDLLLRAFAKIKRDNIILEISGEFYDDSQYYFDLIEELNLQDSVVINNRYLSDEDMSIRLAAADLMILPYRRATQSGIAMAAFAAGVPVIASDVGALPDIIVDGKNGYITKAGNVISLSEALERFIEDDVEIWRSRRSEIASETERKYSWKLLVSRVLNFNLK